MKIKKLGVALVASLIIAIGTYCTNGTPQYVPFGVNFSPYKDKQDPTYGTLVITPTQVSGRLNSIRGNFRWIRTFSCTHGLDATGPLAHKLGFKTALGAWLGPETDAAGKKSNEDEIIALVAAARRGEADMVIVGSEVLLRGDIGATNLISYMRQVRAAIPANIPVTTVDIYSYLTNNPAVLNECDVVMANFYPYWEGTRIDSAINQLDGEYRGLVKASGSKPVWIAETGWPSDGNTIYLATPSPLNAAYYFLAFTSWARANNVNALYFEAYDEKWKMSSEGPQGAHWGIWTSTGSMKANMRKVFQGYILPEAAYLRNMNFSTLPGNITIQITMISAYGSDGGIAGRVTGIRTSGYKVATYIQVFGGWWTKPYFSQPTVPVSPDGTFYINTVTGGYDAIATAYAVFLIPADYSPPLSGGGGIPGDVYAHAVANAYADRPTDFPGSDNTSALASITSLAMKRSWSGSPLATDIVTIKGTLPIVGSKPHGSELVVSVGSIDWKFGAISRSGAASVVGTGTNRQSGTIVVTPTKSAWKFTINLRCAPEITDWTNDGMLNLDLSSPGIPVFIPINIMESGKSYGRLTSGYYTAKQGKTGVLTGSAK